MARIRSRQQREFERYERESIKAKCTGCGKEIYVMSERHKKDAQCMSCGMRSLMSMDFNAEMVKAAKKDFAAGRISKKELDHYIKKYGGKKKK